jgi:hypothetical protein
MAHPHTTIDRAEGAFEVPTSLDVCAANRTQGIDIGESTTHASLSPLLCLPLEIRQRIYGYHFGHGTLQVPLDQKLVILEDWYRYTSHLPSSKRNILTTNHQIHREASDILWHQTTVISSFYSNIAIGR